MKFVYLSSLFMACALSAGAQGIYQFEDPGFEKTWENNKEPGHGWHSFASAGGKYSWAASASPKPSDPGNGHESDHSVKLVSNEVISGKKANGNLTTGRVNMGDMNPASGENYNYTEINGKYYLQFKGIPDEVTFWTKFTAGNGNVDKKGRGQFILHDRCEYRDPEVDNLLSHRIAMASGLISESSDWVPCRAVFDYDVNDLKDIPTEKYLLASFTTNPNPGQSAGDQLYIDDVYFVYYSDLSSLTYNGKKIDYSEDKSGKEITVTDFSNEFYNSEKLQYKLRGKGAVCEGPVYDSETGIVTLTIKGDDFGHEVDPEKPNQTVYKIQFKPIPILGEYDRLIKVDMGNNTTFPSINSVTISESESKDGTVAFTMKDFTFAGEMPVGDVTLTGATLSYADNGSINITAPEQELSLLLGSIYTKVSLKGNVAVVNGKKELTADVNINWYSDPTDMTEFTPIEVAVSAIPFNTTLEGKTLKVTGSVAADEAAAVIPTDANSLAAPVKVDVNVVDLTETALTGDITSSAFEAKNPNTLFYAAEGATLTGDNVVKGTECENLVLTDGQSFNAPEGFTANQITYKRATTASTEEKDEVYTFVLPFTFTADKVNGTVYELTGVNDGVLDFTSIEGELKANRPYLVVSDDTELLNASAFSGEVVATGDLTNEVYGGVTMVGAYEATPVKSEGSESWYGYNADGKFVKAKTGTINPFRTAIKSTGSQSSFALKLDGTVTGIVNLENPNAKVDVYTISGVCVRKNVPAASALNGLSRGVYIVGGQKVVK